MISVETYILCKNYTDQQVDLFKWKIKVVEVLPESDIDTRTIYFVPKNIGDEENNYYYEYIYVEEKWELIGSTEFKPDNYMTKQEVIDYVNEHQYVLVPATSDTLGGVIVDTDTISLDTDGKISVVPIDSTDIASLF